MAPKGKKVEGDAGKGEKITPTTRFYGVELEVEAADRDEDYPADIAAKWRDFIVCKSDGSLSEDTGVELVSSPATLAVHGQQWPTIIKYLRQNGFSSFDNERCGIHVHVSRASFQGLSHLMRLEAFLTLDANAAALRRLSQRSAYQLDRWATMRPRTGKAFRCISYATADKKRFDFRSPGTRYVACNVTAKTVEIRLWRGTLALTSFFKCLEGTAAFVQFTQEASPSHLDFNADFVPWLLKQQGYTWLKTWMDRKGMIALPRKKIVNPTLRAIAA
jgi:hypothetical protein